MANVTPRKENVSSTTKKAVKALIDTGEIKVFSAIFETALRTPISKDLKIHYNRLSKMIDNVEEVRIGDLYKFSEFFNVPVKVLFDLVDKQHEVSKRNSPSKKARS